jgi:hypothetical protein
LVDCCLHPPLPAPVFAKAVGADNAAVPSATVLASATAANVAAILTAISANFWLIVVCHRNCLPLSLPKLVAAAPLPPFLLLPQLPLLPPP